MKENEDEEKSKNDENAGSINVLFNGSFEHATNEHYG